MKSLVVYYSRTGFTRSLGQALAMTLEADQEEIRDRRRRLGFLGALGAGWAAMRGQSTEIDPPQRDPGDYDLVVVGTPVWAGSVTPAVLTYLERTGDSLPEVAFFGTMAGADTGRAEKQLRERTGKEPRAILWLRGRSITGGDISGPVAQFARELGIMSL